MEATIEISSEMKTLGEMNWKLKAMSEIISWVSMMKGTVVKSRMNEKYDKGTLNELIKT